MGSIRRAPRSNRWEARYRDPYGAQRTATFDRRSDAQAFLAATETDLHKGAWVDPALGRLRFADFVAESFLPTRAGLELTSQARDLSYLRTHILPVFGARPIASIDYTDCQIWVNDLATRRAAATVVKAAQIMSRVMRMAVRARVIAFNPMAEVERPKVHESEDVFLTAAQVEVLADAMEQVAPRYRALVWVGCYAGPRIGELAALRWSDVDLDNRTLSISRKVVEVSGYGMVEGSTKTKAGRRTITLPRRLVGELERHRERFPSDPLVFTGRDGAQLRANNLRRREWAQAVQLSGLDPAPTFHDMRHTAVSLWVASGASDMEIATYAGHRSSFFTKDRYAHLFKEAGAVLADRLDALIDSARTTSAGPDGGPTADDPSSSKTDDDRQPPSSSTSETSSNT
ncbi:MAG TPA: tyrosine-type recombinase/integrase [Acidimicrobiales bacterium]|nr:tyrosine-type recombinase/integrase [Acidimicrobiales bacterium]